MPLLLHNINNDLEQLKQDGCQLVEPKERFAALMVASSGDPCTTGCTYFKAGTCPAYQKYHSKAINERIKTESERTKAHTKAYSDQSGLIGGQWEGKTIRQIAKAENISLNEARRRKQEGKYAE